MNDKWIEDIRDSLSDYEMDAPEGLWESLGVDRPAAKPIAWRRTLATAAAAVALLIIGSAYFIWQTNTTSLNSDRVYSEVVEPASTQKPNILSDNTVESSHKDDISSQKSKKGVQNAHSALETSAAAYNEVMNSEELLEDESDSKKPDIGTETEEETQNEESIRREYQENKTHSGRSLYEQWQSKQKHRSHSRDRYALAISTSGIGSHSEKSVIPGSIPDIPDINNPWDDPNDIDSDFSDSNSPNTGDFLTSEEITDIRHHLPIKVGLTVQYNISKRIGIESGLMYSMLESDISVSKGNKASLGSRKMQYIGIPINLKFYAWSWKCINVYLSAGIAGEKCISNMFETKSLSEGITLDSYSNMKEKPFQWSTNAAAGLQISPTPIVGIFAEPGVSYYFNDGTSLNTIYKDRPLNFNLNIGIRFNLNP